VKLRQNDDETTYEKALLRHFHMLPASGEPSGGLFCPSISRD
jgi:hypothetical protein